jgi:hypothetical protein
MDFERQLSNYSSQLSNRIIICMFPAGNEMAEMHYRPGEQVPASGVYLVTHVDHRPEHAVTLLENEKFPPCAVCGDQVRFRLERPANQHAAGKSG